MNSSHGNGDALATPFIGFILGAMLFGITLLQTIQYFMRYPKDSVYSKLKVAAIFILDFLNFVFCASLIYALLISNFGVAEAYTKNMWSLEAMANTQTLVIILVQLIYLERIYKLSNIPALRKVVPMKLIMGVIGVVIPCAFAVGVACGYQLHKAEVILSLTNDLTWSVYLGSASPAVIDMTIASLMCYMLHKHKLNVGIHMSRQFDQLVSTLIIYMLGTGLLTSCAFILFIVLFIARPNSISYISVLFFVTRLYANSVLAMLNSRQQNNAKSEFDDSEDLVPLSAIVFGWEDQSTTVRSHNTQSGPGGIEALRLDSQLDLYQGDNTKGALQ